MFHRLFDFIKKLIAVNHSCWLVTCLSCGSEFEINESLDFLGHKYSVCGCCGVGHGWKIKLKARNVTTKA